MAVLIHATCIAIDGIGVLLRGPSGCGKSDLALRLIDQGAKLVADDYCAYEVCDGRLFAKPQPPTAGLIEVRGVGVLTVGCIDEAEVGLLFDLTPGQDIERLPEAVSTDVMGVSVRNYHLNPFESSAPLKVRLAVGVFKGDIIAAT